jgi:O-glycosyl hydrolase
MGPFAGWRTRLAVPVMAATSVLLVVVPTGPAGAAPTTSVTVTGTTQYQQIDGFGVSEAFSQATTLMNAPTATRDAALSLLFGRNVGAGLSIVRNFIPSTSAVGTIEPTAPATPSSPPAYQPLGTDDGQETLAKYIQTWYGVTQFMADAWGAPPFMKTNNADSGGGTLCGVPGATCASGDWRQAYANYLVQYAKDYAADGINLDYLGFENEANLATTYTSMVMTPAQTVNFADVLGPTLASSELPTQLQCCDTEGWNFAANYSSAIEADPTASSYVKLFTSHGYTAGPRSPLAGWTNPVWETEWSTFQTWDPSWDDKTTASGLSWAQDIYRGLTGANLNAFFYWWGTSTPSYNGDNESLVQINGSTVVPSGRLWAFAAFSRFVRPGAIRLATSSQSNSLLTTAFKNTDGSVTLVVINTAANPFTTTFSLSGTGTPDGVVASPYVTNASNSMAKQAGIPVQGGAFSGTVPARSVVTYQLPA